MVLIEGVDTASAMFEINGGTPETGVEVISVGGCGNGRKHDITSNLTRVCVDPVKRFTRVNEDEGKSVSTLVGGLSTVD